jgi:hypothetical protein
LGTILKCIAIIVSYVIYFNAKAKFKPMRIYFKKHLEWFSDSSIQI